MHTLFIMIPSFLFSCAPESDKNLPCESIFRIVKHASLWQNKRHLSIKFEIFHEGDQEWMCSYKILKNDVLGMDSAHDSRSRVHATETGSP